jgi:hypothetical protein
MADRTQNWPVFRLVTPLEAPNRWEMHQEVLLQGRRPLRLLRRAMVEDEVSQGAVRTLL